jgi:hypothetical protein
VIVERSFIKSVVVVWLVSCMILTGSSIRMSSAVDTTVTAMDFVIDFEGYECEVNSYTYEEWSAFLQSNDVPNYDYLEADVVPKQVLVLRYYNAGIGTWIEIHEYETKEDTEQEFVYQKPQHGSDWGKKIFNRFETEEWMFLRDRFLVFVFCTPGYGRADHDRAVAMLEDLLVDFIENLLDVLSGVQKPPPPVSFSGEVVWGIEAGDIITWEQGKSSQYSNYNPKEWTCEIMKISDDRLSVLARTPYEKFWAYNQPGWAGKDAQGDYEGIVYYESFDIPHYDYYWGTVDEGGLKLKDAYYSSVLIYPLYKGGEYLIDMVESAIDYLPETTVTESTETINGFGKTASGSGYTPIETEWLDITVHKGTGIVTVADWYYQDREHDIQAGSEATLIDTNFALQSRQPYSPQGDGPPEEDGEPDTNNGVPPTPANGEQDGESDSPFETTHLVLVAAIVGISGVAVAALLILRAKKPPSSKNRTQ